MNRERITITIEGDLLPVVDKLIDGKLIRNRSHALESAVRSGLALQEMGTVFFIYGKKNPTQEQTEQLAKILQAFPYLTSYVITPSSAQAEALLWHTSFLQQSNSGELPKSLPGDFGSAAALLLAKQTSPHFLIIDLDNLSTQPDTLLSAFVSHHRDTSLVTHLLVNSGLEFSYSGFSFSRAEMMSIIPAGPADIDTDIFPLLSKTRKVSTYVYPI